ncbi:Potassium transporter [Arachis hypogaea]|nr:Potassium transporter [Arachis hypogaea]
MISEAFFIISHALSLGCFLHVKDVHTSTKHEDQVYISEINYMFMYDCLHYCLCYDWRSTFLLFCFHFVVVNL